MIEVLHIDHDTFLYAEDEDVGTIVQDIHGIDYECVCSYMHHQKKYWDIYADCSMTSYRDACYHEYALCIAEASRLRNRACNSYDQDLQEGFVKFMKKHLIMFSDLYPNMTMREKTTKIKKMWYELVGEN